MHGVYCSCPLCLAPHSCAVVRIYCIHRHIVSSSMQSLQLFDVTCYSAGVVVTLARKYRVSLPVLTAVAQVLNGHLNAKEAVYEIMNLPQIEER